MGVFVTKRDRDIHEWIEQQVSLLIRRADITKAVDNMILDRSAYFLLSQLHTTGPQMISTLANMFFLDISTVSRQASALESKGLVQRVSHPENNRVSLLSITELGQKLYQEMRDRRVNRYREILVEWSDSDMEALAEYLSRLNESIDIRAKKWARESREE